MRNDGISIVALIIVLLILSTVGFVFSSLIITKQKSAPLPLRSAQSFYLAEAGIEYAIRYATDNEPDFWTDPKIIFPDPPDTLTKSLSPGSFNVTYNADASITSTGTASIAKRVITLASFPTYVVGGEITLEPGNPPYQGTGGHQKDIYIPTVNNYNYDVYIFQIDLAKEGGNTARLNQIGLGGTTVWTGNKVDVSTDHNSPTLFPFNQVPYYTMAPGAALDGIQVQTMAEVSGTWYLTFHYSKQTDLSDPEMSTITFIIS
jgi:hypothetical protein